MQPSVITHLRAKFNMSQVGIFLHLEGLALFIATLVLYHSQGFSWLSFILCLLLPDLSALGYLISRRAGMVCYNMAHTSTFPLALGLIALSVGSALGMQVALIWLAHIGMDRTVGYNLREKPHGVA